MDFSRLGLLIQNIFIPSMPEQLFLTYLTLFFIGRSDDLIIKSRNVYKILLCSFIGAAISVVLREAFPFLVASGIFAIIGILISFLLVVLIYRIFTWKMLLKTFIFNLISFIIFMIFQLSYIPLLMAGTSVPVEKLSSDGLILFIFSLPEIAIFFAVISIINTRKNFHKKVKFFNVLTKNKNIMIITIVLAILNISFLLLMIKLIVYNKILFNMDILIQLMVIAAVNIFPVINISLLFTVVYNTYYRETIRVMLSKERMSTLVSIMKVYAEEDNFEKMDNVVEDLYKQVNNL